MITTTCPRKSLKFLVLPSKPVKLKSGAIHGRPTTFNPIVIHRAGNEPDALRRLRAQVAGGIAHMLGDLGSALWIMPT